ncbi:MAG: GTPase domain-containing protein [Deltaproteobacteria bacterium]|nr:GTPase domain-containing protein [Deltaproteobacteria bacterium]
MAFIDFSKREIQCKIVYYGPGRGGKTTNLLCIHKAMNENVRGEMVSINTKGDRTLFFDFLPLSLGSIRNMNIKIQLYTVPGQTMYNASRKLVLKGVDGIVFVADSLRVRKENNIEALANMEENLKGEKIDITQIPLVMQYNKRDLVDGDIPIMPIEELEQDLNGRLRVPVFPGSALNGNGVFETLREISKITVKHVHEKLIKR